MCSHQNHARELIYTKYYVQACGQSYTLSTLCTQKWEIQNLQKAYETVVGQVTLNTFEAILSIMAEANKTSTLARCDEPCILRKD